MKKSILIADDNEKIRQLLKQFFQSYPSPFEVHEACDGLEAVTKVSELNLYLIVLDLSMPRLNGLGAARKMRELQVGAPIILFTMHAEEVEEAHIRSTGISAVVMKPDLTALSEQVQVLLNDGAPA